MTLDPGGALSSLPVTAKNSVGNPQVNSSLMGIVCIPYCSLLLQKETLSGI